MANNNKNINELVTNDDDLTVELETLVRQQSLSKPNNRLQLDMERFRAKWLGLTTDVRQRDQKIRGLESEIREFNSEKRIATLTSVVAAAKKNAAQISEELASLQKSHTDEIRMIRLELGEAQETMSQNDLISEQLESDLVETQAYRAELERMLNKFEHTSQSRIEHLEKENLKLRRESDKLVGKMGSKNQSINCLLAELAEKGQQTHSIEVLEDAKHDVDDRLSAKTDAPVPAPHRVPY